MAYDMATFGECILICGDSTEVLPRLPLAADLILTDPPYAIQDGGAYFARTRPTYRAITDTLRKGCDYRFLAGVERWVVFCNKDQLPELLQLSWERPTWSLLTWHKSNPSPLNNNNYLPDTEYIVHAYTPGALYGDYPDRSKFFLSGVNTWPRYSTHPTEKPLALIQKLVRCASQPGELVVDPFAGSGTTAHACLTLGRRCIAIEHDRARWEEACQRLATAYQQLSLFRATTAPATEQLSLHMEE